MSRSDVTNLQIDYRGGLEDLALHLQLKDITYDQEMMDGELEEYVYGNIGPEIIEAIRLVGQTRIVIFKCQPAGAFSPDCLEHILVSIRNANAKVTSYWTQESISKPRVLHEGSDI